MVHTSRLSRFISVDCNKIVINSYKSLEDFDLKRIFADIRHKQDKNRRSRDMTDNRYRRLPVGIQSFKVTREENYLYVDKSDIVWNMVNLGDYSRPYRHARRPLPCNYSHCI